MPDPEAQGAWPSSTIPFSVALAIDPARARAQHQRLAAKLPAGSAALAIATALATAYPALAPGIEADPSGVTAIAAEGHRAARDRAGLYARLRRRVGDLADSTQALAELRRAAREERLRIAFRELLAPELGGADVDVTSGEIAALAEVILQIAFEEAVLEVTRRFGEPRTAAGPLGRMVILGMGKLGGGELNAGSDVDLIFLYDSDEGLATGPGGRQSSLHEIWTRVARRITATLEEPTSSGMLWRVDLRLRPEGRTGPLVNSLAAAERYYESFGRLWERAALLRARPVAGDLPFGEQALRALDPFVWRRRVDPSIAVEMAQLVRRARAELSHDPARDLKLGPGGIREAEFFVQSLQLIWGGREPRVRAGGTLEALRRLHAAGFVTDREDREIGEAYLALRRAEHAVQTGSGLETHLVPENPDDLERTARALGFPAAAAFESDRRRHSERIAARFASLAPGAPPASRWSEVLAALDRSDPDGLGRALARAGVIEDPAAPIDELARDLLELARHPDAPFGTRSRESFAMLAERMLDAIADAADPEQAARYLRMFFARVRQPGVYVKLLGDDPRAAARLVAALGASAFVGEAVAHTPELGDLVLSSRGGIRPSFAREEVAAQLALAQPSGEHDEPVVAALRRAKARITVEVALADLAEEIGTREATLTLSALADASLEAAVRHTLGDAEGLTILALGKLGGRDLGYGSDLDVIFLFDPARAPAGRDPQEHFAREARRIIRLITISHPAGLGYEIDTRLRPSGNQGLLVTSIEAFARYHGVALPGEGAEPPRRDDAPGPRPRAAAWERMALVRLRFVAGDPELGAKAIAVARDAHQAAGDPREAAREVHRLRVRMERELGRERPGRYDLKLGRGGLTDVEFAVQLLQMSHGERLGVRTSETLQAIDALAAEGCLAPDLADALREGHVFLSRLEQRIRVVHADASHLLEERAPGLAPLARRMGIRDRPRAEARAELLARYREVTCRVRAAYDTLVVAAQASPTHPERASRRAGESR